MESAASGFDQLASMESVASGFDQLASMEEPGLHEMR